MSKDFISSSAQEEQMVIRLAQGGDEAAVASVMTAYVPLVRRWASNVFCPGVETEDLVQEGSLGLFSAIISYDCNSSVKFSAYASVCVKHSILTAVRSASRLKHLPLNQSLSMDDEEQMKSVTLTSSDNPEAWVVSQEQILQIQSFLKQDLSTFEQSVLKAYLSGAAYEEIAKELDVDSKAIDNALQRVRRKLKAFCQ